MRYKLTIFTALAASAMLSACSALDPYDRQAALDPIQYVDTPDSRQQLLSVFRGYACAQLIAYDASMRTHYLSAPPADGLTTAIKNFHEKMSQQVQTEKQCQSSPALPVKSPAAKQIAGRKSAADSKAAAPSIEIDSISPALAQGLGLETTQGVLIVNVRKGSAAAKAGLMPLDVIQEISGQTVAGPSDFNDIVDGLRQGYKTQVKVWRQKAVKNLMIDWRSTK